MLVTVSYNSDFLENYLQLTVIYLQQRRYLHIRISFKITFTPASITFK